MKIEHADEEVEAGDQHEQEHGLVRDGEALVGHGLPGEAAAPDDAHRAVDRTFLPPTMASRRPQTLTGRVLSATTVSLVIVPIWSSV